VSFFKDMISEATEAQKVGAQTAAVLKSTGGAANVTAKQIGALATAISNKVGIDDEAIQSGANLLLTFKNVRNEAGKGNDIFNQSVGVITDMSAALGQDMKSSSIQLGKALNDPIKGITALSRVGVTFDEGQKKQIKTLMAHGHTLAAQKIILRELNSEFKGSAAAQATPAEKAQVAWGNFKELLGTAVLPIVGKVANFLSQKLIPAMAGFVTGMQNGTGSGGKFVAFLKGAGDVVRRFGKFLVDNKDFLIAIAGGLLAAKTALVAYNAYVRISAAVTKGWAIAQKLLNGSLRANPIGLVVTALALLVGGAILAYRKVKWFHDGVNAAWKGIRVATSFAWNNVIKPVFAAMKFYLTNVLFPVYPLPVDNVVQPVFKGLGAPSRACGATSSAQSLARSRRHRRRARHVPHGRRQDR
jgi:acid phosphatase family membrane protein YuiD